MYMFKGVYMKALCVCMNNVRACMCCAQDFVRFIYPKCEPAYCVSQHDGMCVELRDQSHCKWNKSLVGEA